MQQIKDNTNDFRDQYTTKINQFNSRQNPIIFFIIIIIVIITIVVEK